LLILILFSCIFLMCSKGSIWLKLSIYLLLKVFD
jgi:hypothetical protein